MGLETYHEKRNFRHTPEPKGHIHRSSKGRFVVQEHYASRLHYDFRLEMDGVLKSWAIPKGPSMNPQDKRLAVAVEDHPIEYINFKGVIEEGNYGAGEVFIWDKGNYSLIHGQNAADALKKGKLDFEIHGKKLKGNFSLVRMAKNKKNWLLIKKRGEGRYAKRTAKRALLRDEPRRTKAPTQQTPSSDLTSLDKIYWPQEGITKGDLLQYYSEIAPFILPHLKDRPLILKRYPNGIDQNFFYTHDVRDAPPSIPTQAIPMEEKTVHYLIGGSLKTLLYTVNLGTIAQNPWHSRITTLEKPDWVVFDLDPGEKTDFKMVRDLSLIIKDYLNHLDLESYAKTSGSNGIHITVPLKAIHDYDTALDFARLVAETVERENPEIATTERSLKKRSENKIYVDYLQNSRGKSIVAPYSLRAKPGATVATPVDWKEVKSGFNLEDFNMKNISQRIKKKGDLFAPVLKQKQMLKKALERLRK